jgi:hypothetical protein
MPTRARRRSTSRICSPACSGPVPLLLDGLDELSSRGFELIVHIRRRLAELGHDLDVHLPADTAGRTVDSAHPPPLGFVA